MDRVFGIFLALFGLLFSGVGLWFVGAAMRNIFLGFVSRNWQPTIGTIVSSQVSIDSGLSARSGAIILSGTYRYRAKIRYEYAAGNARRSGSKVRFAEINSRDLRAIQAVVHRYPASSTTTVFFDPSDTQRAVLEPGFKASNFATVTVGALLVLFGAAFVFGGLFGFDRLLSIAGPGVLFRLVTSLGLVGGAAALALGLMTSRRARASRQWALAKGVVVSSRILREISSSPNSQSGRIVGDHQYKPEVAYEYSVRGIKYISNKVSFADYSSNATGHAESITADYPEGKVVDVFYNPDNPEDAVLQKKSGFGVWIIYFAGLFLLAVSALFLYLGPERFAK